MIDRELGPQLVDDADLSLPQPEPSPLSKGTVVKSVFWNAVGSYSGRIIQFVIGIVMARVLMPSQYGIIAIIGVFIEISQVFIDSGMTTGLVRKKDCSKEDYHTVFTTNFCMSSLFFVLLFFAAPFIADFYEIPELLWTTRVLALSLIINSLAGISRIRLVKDLRFKTLSLVSLSTGLITGAIGITMAYSGFGVWALVLQVIFGGILNTMILVFISPTKPCFGFDKTSFKEFFSFGYKLLGSNIVYIIFNNLQNLILGKFYTPAGLGYFTRADGYVHQITINVNGLLSGVMVPLTAKIQDDKERMINFYKKITGVLSFYIFPGTMLLGGLAYPLILNMLSSKWLPCVPLMQILCLGCLFDHITSINGNYLVTKGYSGAFLKMQMITKPITLAVIFTTVFFNLTWVAWGKVLISGVNLFASCYYFRKFLQMPILKLLRRLVPELLTSLAIGFIAMYLFHAHLAPTVLNTVIVFAGLGGGYIAAGCLWFKPIVKDSLNVFKLKQSLGK